MAPADRLPEPGGRGRPGLLGRAAKALAAEYEVADATADGGVRAAVPAVRWPSPFATDGCPDANGGALPPDFSVLAKARGVKKKACGGSLNYFTGYSEGGPDYIHALLNGYHEEAP